MLMHLLRVTKVISFGFKIKFYGGFTISLYFVVGGIVNKRQWL